MERINRLITNRDYRHYLAYNRKEEENRYFCRHQFEHLVSVARLTYLLLLEEGNSTFIGKEAAYAAGLLHDIGRWHQYRFGTEHEETSATLAEPLLEEAGFNTEENRLIIKAIKQHRLNLEEDTGNRHISPLGKALNRADKLSRLCINCGARNECKKISRQPQKERLIY